MGRPSLYVPHSSVPLCSCSSTTHINCPDPDNYTDQATFLEQLQRNPRLQPYDFWPLVTDTTVIVQQVCSVIIFVACFVGIFQERASHLSVVSCASALTFLGWLLWERWEAEEEAREEKQVAAGGPPVVRAGSRRRAGSVRRRATLMQGDRGTGVRLDAVSDRLKAREATALPAAIPEAPVTPNRMHQRLATLKSGVLISSILLGLSPILKSLTRSTSSDSIWAMCLCLLLTNIISFDYSSQGPNHPASLSTNAALMASTVLASRLPSTGQVFSLTVLSIEVFGLFPVLRRYTRERPSVHAVLTALLVLGAGAGTGIVAGRRGAVRDGVVGMGVGAVVAGLAMGGCSWWLIGLQKYKNEINGPWDAARPVIISRRY